MVLKKLHFLYFFLILFFITSCYREFNITPPACTNCTKPVVLCFISPGNPIRAYATVTAQFAGSQPYSSIIFDGQIILADSIGNSIELTKSNENQRLFHYQGNNFEIKQGWLYTLTVVSNNGIISTAHTRVPKIADSLISFSIIGFREDEYGYKLYSTKIKWNKNTNYKNIIGYSESISEDEIPNSMYLDYYFYSPISENNIAEHFYTEYWRYKTIVTLFTINEPFSSYLSGYLLYNEFTMLDKFDDFYGVFNGILPEYTNFDNSLGVFGAYVTDTISVVNHYPSPY